MGIHGMAADSEESREETDEVSDEARKLKKLRMAVKAPTAAEREEHNRTHLPYRSWCPVCIAGRGVADHHRKSEEEERTQPEVAFDYCFMRNRPNDDFASVPVSKDK